MAGAETGARAAPSRWRIAANVPMALVCMISCAIAQTDEPAMAGDAPVEMETLPNLQPSDRLLDDPIDPIAPGEPGFLLDRLAGEEEEAQRILLPPAVTPLPPSLLQAGTPEAAYGAFQRGHYLTALDLALPLAEEGEVSAQTLVAELFAEGFAVPRDMEQAAFWYGQAAAGGDPVAQFKYALMLLSGRHAERDVERGRALMQAAADQGNPIAQFNYGQILVERTPGERGLMDALPYFEKAAEQGIADAQYALSQIYLNAVDISEANRDSARQWLLRAARAGYDTAQLDLAIWLVDGIGGESDYEAGFRWMQRAAVRGNVIAQNRLAHLYIEAIGTRPDPVEAGKWYVLSRRAGLNDPVLQDFFRGLTDEEQRQAIEAANSFRR
nr:tetratricopeptide repeat protein [Pararhizobium haloflavum]